MYLWSGTSAEHSSSQFCDKSRSVAMGELLVAVFPHVQCSSVSMRNLSAWIVSGY